MTAEARVAVRAADAGSERLTRKAQHVFARGRFRGQHPGRQSTQARFVMETVQRRVVEHERIVTVTLGIAYQQRFVARRCLPCDQARRIGNAIEQRVVVIRDAHPAWGARKIARCLERAGLSRPAISTVHQILLRSGRIEAPPGGAAASQRFEMPAPNLLWQMDFKGWIRLGNDAQCHPLTVVDDHSRYDLCLQACADQRGDTVRERLEGTFTFPFAARFTKTW